MQNTYRKAADCQTVEKQNLEYNELVILSIFFHGDTLSVVVSPVICELKLYFLDVWESFAFTDFSAVCLLVPLECLSLGLMKFRLLFMCFIIISM